MNSYGYIKRHLRDMKAAFLGTAAILALPLAAHAQTGTTDNGVESVVVTGSFVQSQASTATKTDTPILVTPQSVSVITRDQLTLQNPQDIGQAISYSSGVSPSEFGFDPRFPQFQIRGFNEFYGGLYQDGLRLPASDFIAPLLEPYGLEQLEIVRGPTSVLYGQNNPGGMVNLTTKRATDGTFGEAQIQVGSFDRYDGRFDFNTPLTDDDSVQGRITGLYREANTQYPNVPDDEYYLAPSLTWKPRQGTTITFLANVQRVSGGESDEYYAKYLLPPGYPQSVYQGDPNFGHSTQRSFAIGYMLDQTLDSNWSLHQSFRFNDSEDDLIVANPITFDTATTLLIDAEHLHETMDSIALDTNVTGKVETGPLSHTLIFGVDYLNSPFSSLEHDDPAPDANYFNPVYTLALPMPTTLTSATHQGASQVGLYAQDQIQYGDHWFLTGGLREDFTSQSTSTIGSTAAANQEDNALTGRIGLVYLTDIGLAPYISYSTSFVPQQGTDYAGHAFDPLTGKQVEGGIRYMPKSGWISLTASVYDITEQNVLSADPNPAHIGYQVETGEERSRGFEFEGILTPMPGMNVTAAYTYDDVRITQTTDPTQLNHQPGNTPATQVSVFGDYTFQNGFLRGFGGGAGLRYTGPSYDGPDNVFRNGSQTYFDADLHYAVDHWRIALNGTNLADSHTPVCFGGVCHFSRDRTLIGSITRTF